MSSEKEPNNKKSQAFFIKIGEPHPISQALESVQTELDREKEARKEERFYWICFLILLIDVGAFAHMPTWSGPIALTFIEFVVLVALGRKLGVDHIWTLTEKLIDKWDGGLSNR